jgi:hypothetical protein
LRANYKASVTRAEVLKVSVELVRGFFSFLNVTLSPSASPFRVFVWGIVALLSATIVSHKAKEQGKYK